MKTLHVLMSKDELEADKLADKVVVVFDVIAATSTSVAALAHGARAVLPVLDPEAARRAAADMPPESYVLAGEHLAKRIPGFAPPEPLNLLRGASLAGKTLILSTTNGTVALKAAERAARVYAGSLLNGRAIARHLRRAHAGETVLLCCAGAGGTFSIEDFLGAGHVAQHLVGEGGDKPRLTDAAMVARLFASSQDAERVLIQGRAGRQTASFGRTEDVRYCARKDILDVVPVLREGRLETAIA